MFIESGSGSIFIKSGSGSRRIGKSGSWSGYLMTKNKIKILFLMLEKTIILEKNWNIPVFILRLPWRTSKEQNKPLDLQREYPAQQKKLNFLTFCGSFLTSPQIRIRIPYPDPDPQAVSNYIIEYKNFYFQVVIINKSPRLKIISFSSFLILSEILYRSTWNINVLRVLLVHNVKRQLAIYSYTSTGHYKFT